MTTTENRDTGTPDQDIREQAAQNTLAANALVGVRGQDIANSARMLLGQMVSSPALVARQYFSFLGELGRIATGRSELAPDAKDKRFADPAWKESTAYRALAQCYLAWGDALNKFVDEAKLNKRDTERARFVVSLLVDAMSPTNSLAGNPAALKKLIDTAGASLVHGLENLVGDLAHNGGLPAQVDKRKFEVGKNLGDDPGLGRVSQPGAGADPVPADGECGAQAAAPHRPAADQQVLRLRSRARARASSSSLVKGDLQTFVVSWKNPTAAESHFGLDTYVGALRKPIDVMRDITGSEDVNIWGACSGGITISAFLAQPRGARRTQGPQRHARGLRARHGDRPRTRTAGALRHAGDRSPRRRAPRSSRACSKARSWRACSPGCGPTT